jgi:arginase
MRHISLPFHLHERRERFELPVEPDVTIDDIVPTEPTWPALAGLYERVAAEIAAVHPDGPPVLFSGDCCAAVGAVAGLARLGIEPTVVWIDGHGDFNTPETSISGYLGGMVLSFLTGRGDPGVIDRLGFRPVPDERIVLVDARDLDPAEEELLRTTGVRHVALAGVEGAVAAVRSDEPILLHVDLDVLDPSELPGLLFPAAGGHELAAVVDAVRAVAGTGRLAAASIGCTWHPAETDPERCREVVDAVLAAIGRA